jgi:hypothetical protein
MQLTELLSEVSAARQQGKQAVVHAAVAALQAALTSLPQAHLSAATAAAAGGAAAAAAALVGDLGPDAQVGRSCSAVMCCTWPSAVTGVSLLLERVFL